MGSLCYPPSANALTVNPSECLSRDLKILFVGRYGSFSFISLLISTADMIMYLSSVGVAQQPVFGIVLLRRFGLQLSRGPALFLLRTLPRHNSWKPPTLRLCDILSDPT